MEVPFSHTGGDSFHLMRVNQLSSLVKISFSLCHPTSTDMVEIFSFVSNDDPLFAGEMKFDFRWQRWVVCTAGDGLSSLVEMKYLVNADEMS